MSQAGVLSGNGGGGGGTLSTLTGNSGGAVGPDGAANINILGSGAISVVGNPGTNTLTISQSGAVATSYITASGTATPSAGVLNILGSSGITTSGAGSTVTITGIQSTTSQIGVVTLASNAQAIAGVDTSNAITSVALAAKLGTQTAHSLAVFEGTSSAITALGAAINGQIPIGSTGADPVLATLTAGANITITNGAGTISIAASGAITWADQTGSFTPAATHGYFITGTSTATMPAAPTVGDTIYFILDTTNILTITANTGQFIRLGTTVSAAAGTCVSNARGDAITLVYRATDTTWLALNSVGTWTIT